jgi:hypothetical protein
MARTQYGRFFRTRAGKYGRYKYVNGRRVGFVLAKRRFGASKYFRYNKTRRSAGWRRFVHKPNRRYK